MREAIAPNAKAQGTPMNCTIRMAVIMSSSSIPTEAP